ncbi:glycosyl transferase [Sulfodiicoccus acidiphilus]|uniref:Glycosyl transferase n=1 Tax=Sulfodiicoccus acidiphilus TaxID=1670455 RepID=A0A348B3R2_9CREN|nr:glycosyltransferase family 4 protein [Sulfodiicoccus acidiphilus]BBD72814.1 glycosyl transferase [Sulfodiicoccus acidiphilus]GGU04285.1 glycosyl transferase [Sulfodiicoccus acidiphilus]
MSSIAINSQTPPIRFDVNYREILERYDARDLPLDVSKLEPSDYTLTVGGVAKMMLGMISKGRFSRVRWVSLGPGYPPSVKMGEVEVHFIDLDPSTLRHYTNFKEGLYNEAHGVRRYDMSPKDYIAYATYNWMSSQKLLEFYDDTDLYFINDFQQLLIGGIIGPSAPTVLWYHIPVAVERLSPKIRDFLLKSFEGFDEVIVSTKRDLESLVRAGARVKARQVYPFIDVDQMTTPNRAEVDEVSAKFNLKPDDKVIVVVGRMDPIKSQDVAIKAMNKVEGKLVLVGNGSFTSKSLGYNKASSWASKLKALVRELKLEDKVIFTGYVEDHQLNALYQRADVVLLPSNVEGFGLVACEGWAYEKPAVVSSGAGVSELVLEGVNGYVFRAGDHEELARKLELAFKDPDRMGKVGKETVRKCSVEAALERLKEVFSDAMAGYVKR